jgi:phage gp45-like
MAIERQTSQMASIQSRMGGMSRATVREFDDNHLMQQVKQADVLHSETPSDFERWQMVGITATPMKQDQDQQQQGSQQSGGQQGGQGGQGQDDWNHDQPKGDAAEAVMMYLNGQRSHPIAMVDDRRVRPYQIPEGGSAFYAATGTGQMAYHNDAGSYLIVTNNPKHGDKSGNQTERYASLRHVNKKPQDRKPQQQSGGGGGGASAAVSTLDGSSGSSSSGSSQQYQHEGESVNSEVRCTSGTIEFWVGGSKVGYYAQQGSKWSFTGEMHLGTDSADHPVYGVNGGKGMTTATSGSGAVLVNAPNPGPPTSGDLEPLELSSRLAAMEARLAELERRLGP